MASEAPLPVQACGDLREDCLHAAPLFRGLGSRHPQHPQHWLRSDPSAHISAESPSNPWHARGRGDNGVLRYSPLQDRSTGWRFEAWRHPRDVVKTKWLWPGVLGAIAFGSTLTGTYYLFQRELTWFGLPGGVGWFLASLILGTRKAKSQPSNH